jgi:hypothetical protein
MKSQENKQLSNLDLKWVVQTLRKGSLGFLYALLAALIQAEDKTKPQNSIHLNFEKEHCISKIKTKLESSDNPVRLVERAWSFLKLQPKTN